MDIFALADELTSGHPGTGPYDPDDAVAAAQFNVVNRTINRTSMTGSEVLNAVNADEWAVLTPDEQRTVWDIVHLGNINPFGVEAALMIGVFGGGATTITALQAARQQAVSRAVELGLGRVRAGDVQKART